MRPFLLGIALSAFAAVACGDEFAYSRTESKACRPGTRMRRLARTLVFAQRQLYDPAQNVLHRYTDRPLFSNPTTRALNEERYNGGYLAFLRDIRILRSCGFDGFGSLDYPPVHLDQLRFLDSRKEKVDGYSQMIVFPGYSPDDRFPELKNMVLEASKSSYTSRIDGKLVIWCYGGGAEAQRRWAECLRADSEIPPFLFVGDMPFMKLWSNWSGGAIPKDVLADARADIRASARVMDGFQLWMTDCAMEPDGEYGWETLPAERYEKCLLPEALAALSDSGRKDRLLGLYIRNGYVNPFTGVVYREDGTTRLRRHLDAAVRANPDILMLFEWNEENENTHFQPTVAHGRTWTRILAYYRSLMDKTVPRPLSGDDLSIPNLVVSLRREIKLGEPFHLELLYVPDGADVTGLTARVTLVGADGREIGRFPLERLPTDELTAVSYRVPSESLARHEAVTVELETEYRGVKRTWRGFGTTVLSTTSCRDYLYVHSPLRELFEPEDVAFDVSPKGGGRYAVSASFRAGKEAIASLEVVDGIDEIAAAGPGQAEREPTVTFRGRLTALSADRAGCHLPGKICVRNVAGANLVSANGAWEGFEVLSSDETGWKVKSNFSNSPSTFLLSLPAAAVQSAGLSVGFEKIGRHECSLADVYRLGRMAFQLPCTARMEIERVDDLPDLPVPLGANAASLRTSVMRPSGRPVFTLRAVSKGGKIWRSKPVLSRVRGKGDETIRVFSETLGRPVSVNVAKERVPMIDYAFTNLYGCILPCPADRRWDADVGGGELYAEPMLDALSLKKVPEDFERSDPEWTVDGSRMALRFDGRGSYVTLPQEAIPCGAVFSLSFEIRPEGTGDCVLLRQRMYGDDGFGLNLTIVGGRLRVAYFGRNDANVCHDTQLEMPAGKWSTVVVSRDFETITCRVNDCKESFPYSGRGLYFSGAVFGSDVAPGRFVPKGVRPFKGLLRALKICHGKTFE